jgi:ornithine--oxo-acid transaminase
MSITETQKFDLKKLVQDRRSEQFDLFEKFVNPKLIKVLRTIGFDRQYVHAEGAYLWDSAGNRYLDFLSAYGVFNIGRNHPVIGKTIQDYLDLLDPWKVQLGASLLPGLLAERLLGFAPHLSKVQFTNSGAECTEAAMKFVRCATGRQRILYFDRAFHGLSYGSLSMNGCNSFREGFGSFLPGVDCIPFGDLEVMEKELAKGDVAAIFVEPIQGKGVFPATDEYLLATQDLCRKFGAYVVLDEVQTGMGRTGKMFAFHDVVGLEPDLLLVSKSLSGGMVPVGAVLMRDEIYHGVFSSLDRCVVHSSTFGQGGLAMACGLATLDILESERLPENAAKQGATLLSGLRAMAERFELVKEVRGRGLMIGIELCQPKSFGLKSSWKLIHAADGGLFPQSIIMPLMDDYRILTQVAGHNMDIIKLLPPLTISDQDTSYFLEAFGSVLEACHRFLGPAWTTASRLVKFSVTSR